MFTSIYRIAAVDCAFISIATTYGLRYATNRGNAVGLDASTGGGARQWCMNTLSVRTRVDSTFVGITAINRGILTTFDRIARIGSTRVLVTTNVRRRLTSSCNTTIGCTTVVVIASHINVRTSPVARRSDNAVDGTRVVIVTVEDVPTLGKWERTRRDGHRGARARAVRI